MNRRMSLDAFVGISQNGRRVSRNVETKEAQDKTSPQGDQTIGDEGLNQSIGNAKNSFRKNSATFHKLFEDIPEEEMLIGAFTCSLQKEGLYHGKLFVSKEHICFYSSMLLKETKVVIPTSSVSVLKRHKTLLSSLSIHTDDGDKYHLIYVKNSTTCYELLQSVCLHREGESANSSPQMSSAENEGHAKSGYSHEESTNSRNNSMSLDKGDPHSPSDTGIAGKTTPLPPERDDKTFHCAFYVLTVLILLLLFVAGYIAVRIVALERQLSTMGDLSLYTPNQKT